MKAFAVALLLFALVIVGVIFNAIYINEASERLSGLVGTLPEVGSADCEAATDALWGEWQSRRSIIELSTDLRRTSEIDIRLAVLRVAARDGNVAEYNETRAVLGYLFSELRVFESLEFFDIF
jgi:hypothetical protein